jgi:UDP-N-acetylmuramate-alanine ligase
MKTIADMSEHRKGNYQNKSTLIIVETDNYDKKYLSYKTHA